MGSQDKVETEIQSGKIIANLAPFPLKQIGNRPETRQKKAKDKYLGKIKGVDEMTPVKVLEQKEGAGAHQRNESKGMAHDNASYNNTCTKDIFTALDPPVHHAKSQDQQGNTEAEGKGSGKGTLDCTAGGESWLIKKGKTY